MRIIKLIAFFILITAYFLNALLFYPFFLVDKYWTRKQLTKLVSFYSQAFLLVLRIKPRFIGEEVLLKNPNHLIVSNHLSYLDILIISSKIPSAFVTSTDIKATPFLGQIVTLAGCLFVNRKNKNNLKHEIQELRKALESGLNVVVFPEATSTNGDEVIRFRHPLFESSIATEKPILPLTLNYHSISNEPVTTKNRDIVCWYGEMGFFSHFLKVLDQSEIQVKVHISEPFLPSMINSIEAALKSHKIVSQNYRSLNQDRESTCLSHSR